MKWIGEEEGCLVGVSGRGLVWSGLVEDIDIAAEGHGSLRGSFGRLLSRRVGVPGGLDRY